VCEKEYKAPKEGKEVPKGYDYSPPQGYQPDQNPTFPKVGIDLIFKLIF
jgi:hypothetical protein